LLLQSAVGLCCLIAHHEVICPLVPFYARLLTLSFVLECRLDQRPVTMA